ncbi:MAG: spermidine synthase [Deltaproteobacteria bacterium]|nr:spermidine synthase [Deltaproteobacteria bacterium]
MAWRHLDQGRVGELPLDLYERDGEYQVRVDGQELMSSLCHASEEALADLAAAAVPAPAPRVLVAGLGLGYTLAALVRRLGGAAVEVVEKSPDVLRWYRLHFREKVLRGADDGAVRFREADAVDVLRAGTGGWDLVVLDVDNGPEPLAGEGNRWLYEAAGLAAIRARLRPGGALLVWSGFRSEPFEARAREAGYAVSSVEIPLTRPGVAHHLYLCALPR